MPNWKAAGPDSRLAVLLKIDHPEFARCFDNLLVNVWKTGRTPQQWKDATTKILKIMRDRFDCSFTGEFHLLPMQANCY